MKPEKIISPAVVTSKAADKDFDNIRSQHDSILEGMAMQSMKVQAGQQQKAAELQNQNAMKMDMDKAKMTADTAVQKNAMDFALKTAELDIKRSALAAS